MSSSGVVLNLRTFTGSKSSSKRSPNEAIAPENLAAVVNGIAVVDCASTEAFEKLRAADNLEKQIDCVRKFISELDQGQPCCQSHIDILIRYFFLLPISSSFRRALASSLNRMHNGKESVFPRFESFILDESRSGAECASDVLRSFESCSMAKEAVLHHREHVLAKLTSSLQDYSREEADVGRLVQAVGATARAILCLIREKREGGAAEDSDAIARVLGNIFLRENLPADIMLNVVLCLLYDAKRQKKLDIILKEMVAALDERNGISSDLCSNFHWLSKIKSDYPGRISLCHGLLISAEDEHLFAASENGTKPIALILDVVCDFSRRMKEASAVLQHSKCMNQWVQRLRGQEAIVTDARIMAEVWTYVWSFVDHHLASVRHQILSLIRSLINQLLSSHLDSVKTLISDVMSWSWDLKRKYLALLALADVLDPGSLLELAPTLASDLVSNMSDATIASRAEDVYKSLLKASHRRASSEKQWIEAWVLPLFDVVGEGDRPPEEIERLQVFCMHLSEEAMQLALSPKSNLYGSSVLNLYLLGVKIKKSKSLAFKSYTQDPHFQRTLAHWNTKMRLRSFECLVTSRGSSELFDSLELDACELAIRENIALDCAADRHDFMALFGKMLTRMCDGIATCKDRDQSAATSDFLGSRCGRLLFSSLFEGANIYRRSTALDCIVELFDAALESTESVRSLITKENGALLLNALQDSYEENKERALDLLKHFAAPTLGLNEQTASKIWMDAVAMCADTNPRCSSNAPYQVLLLVRKAEGYALEQTIERLLRILEEHLELARRDLQRAARTKPMYPVLQCIRLVLQRQTSAKDNLRWLRPHAERIIAVAEELGRILSVVLNSDAPEGLTLDSAGQDSDIGVEGQTLLLCAWRSSKEVSLLLGALCALLPSCCLDAEVHLLQPPHVLSISHHFELALETTKHRGAFEQAFVGFCGVCEYMWASEDDHLRRQPAQLLSSILSAVREGAELCGTRRSAGVPFLVQAIVSTEPNATSLPATVEALLTDACDPDNGQVRVHACNILRALFRSCQLAERVAPFVERGVAVAVKAFRSPLWSERNSASLLFSALVGRIFGVKRDTHEFSLKNALTTRMFFQRYRSLFRLVCEELRSAAQLIRTTRGSLSPDEAALYPVLVMLAKLQPPPSTSGFDEFPVTEFLPDLHACCSSSIFNIRLLAARALAGLMPENCHQLFILPLTKAYFANQNALHGEISVMKYLLEFKHMDSFVSSAVFGSDLPALLSSDANPCHVTRCAFLDLLLSALERNPLEKLSAPILEDILLPVATSSDSSSSSSPWASCLRQRVATFCARTLNRSEEALFAKLINSPSADVRLGSLEGLLRRGDAQGLVRFEMLLSETNIDCQMLILELLSKTNVQEDFDEESLLKLIEMIPEFKRSSMKCSALKLCSSLQTRLSFSEDMVKKLLLVIDEELFQSGADCTEVRKEILQIFLNVDNASSAIADRGVNAFIYWKITLWLAYDDDPEIRSTCFLLWQRLLGSLSLAPSRPMPSLLGLGLAAVGLQRAAGEVLLAMMVVAYRTQENSEDQTNALSVFDRSELNGWREDETVVRHFVGAVQNSENAFALAIRENFATDLQEYLAAEHNCKCQNVREYAVAHKCAAFISCLANLHSEPCDK